MGSHAPRSLSPPPPPQSHSLANIVVNFTTRDVVALDRVFRQLRVDDLRVLAAFPEQPHALIHAVVACVHCLLLSLGAPRQHQHQSQVELVAPPWPLLRLELLSNAPQVFDKLHKKLQQLQQQQENKRRKRHVRLVPAQLRFVYRTLEPFYENERGTRSSSHGTGVLCAEYPAVLEMCAHVSSIGAQLAAWVLFCLAASSLAGVGATRAKGHRRDSPDKPSSTLLLPPLATEAQLYKRHKNDFAPAKQATVAKRVRVSVRAGFKIGGRFFLFQANCSSELAVGRSSQSPPLQHRHQHQQQQNWSSVVQWAVLRMDSVRSSDKLLRPSAPSMCTSIPLENGGNENAKRSTNGFWKPRQRMQQSSLSRVVATGELWRRVPKPALTATLFQLGVHAHVFENPINRPHLFPAVSPPVTDPPPIMLKFAAVVCVFTHKKRRQQHKEPKLLLAGIGNAVVSPSLSVAELRLEIQNAIQKAQAKSKKASDETSSSLRDFALLYRGALLPVALESSLSVVALMPFALLVLTSGSGGGGVHMEATSSIRRSAAQLQRLHLETSTALKNAGPPNHLPHANGRHEASPLSSLSQEGIATYYEMQQELLETQTTATGAVISEFFVNWRAFVHFQLLQDSTAVLELSSHDDQQVMRKKRTSKTEAQKIAELQDESTNQLLMLQSREPRVALPSKVSTHMSCY